MTQFVRGSVSLARYRTIRVNAYHGRIVIALGRNIYTLVIRKVPKREHYAHIPENLKRIHRDRRLLSRIIVRNKSLGQLFRRGSIPRHARIINSQLSLELSPHA